MGRGIITLKQLRTRLNLNHFQAMQIVSALGIKLKKVKSNRPHGFVYAKLTRRQALDIMRYVYAARGRAVLQRAQNKPLKDIL